MRKRSKQIRPSDITYKEPGNGLPKWVKELASTRGYADATQPLSLIVTPEDIEAAFACAAQGNGSKCVMAQAGERLGAKFVYFYRTTAWVDPGTGPILRFKTGEAIYRNVIEPYDNNDREGVKAGVYPLTPPTESHTLANRREYNKRIGKDRKGGKGTGPTKNFLGHTDRVVMATQAEGATKRKRPAKSVGPIKWAEDATE
jgi:hypothetical protein